MDEVKQAADDVGMTPEQGETATGGVLSFLKDHLSEDHFKMIEAHIPGAEATVQKYVRGASEGGGFGGMLGGVMSSLGGGSSAGGLAGLMAVLASKGISPAMVQQFLTKIGPLIQQKCGIDITKFLGGAVAGGTAASTTTPADSTTSNPAPTSNESSAAASAPAGDTMSNLMGTAMGMFGK